jgi:type IV pilus assembly protein PilO
MLDQFFDLPLSRRVFIYGIVALLFFALYYFFLHLPGSTLIAEKQTNIESLEAEKVKLLATLKGQEKLQAEVLKAEAEFQEATKQLPESKEIPDLLRQVSNLGRDSGLEITLFRQQGEILKEVYADVPVEMAVRGGYHQLALFFEKVRQLDRIVNIGDIVMKNPQMLDGRLQVEASFSATTYRFLTEEEQAQIAKQKAEEEKKKQKR